MHPEDRVLVAVMNRVQDFEIAHERGWYRVPAPKAPRGIFFEYLAFYFTAAFADLKYAVHYYARNLGHELVIRRDLLPDEPGHPRAGEPYYKLQLGPLQRRQPPIVSRRWRRITFIHTTWDRFEAAEEINDLFIEGKGFVDRLYHALREEGLAPERQYPLREGGVEYVADLAVPCREGVIAIQAAEREQAVPGALRLPQSPLAGTDAWVDRVRAEVRRWGGLAPTPGKAGGERSK